MTDIICGFDVQRKDGALCSWVVPITVEAIPTPTQLDLFTEEVNALEEHLTVLQCTCMYTGDGVMIFNIANQGA